MNEAATYLKNKIIRLEREHAQSINRAADYRAKADELTKKAEEFQVLLRYLKDWDASEFGDTNAAISPLTQPVISSYNGATPVSQLVLQCLKRLQEFSTSELVKAVQEIDPSAKGNSIQGDLSRRKTREEVVQIAPGQYRSMLYEGESPRLPGNGINSYDDAKDSTAFEEDAEEDDIPYVDPFSKEEDENEPGPTFGQIR